MPPEIFIQKNAKRICIYIGESDHWRGRSLATAILETLKTEGIAGATVVRGVAGFGAHSRIHTASIVRLSEDLPLRIEVIDSPEMIAKALETITPMVREGLITVEDVEVVRYTHRYLNPLPADKPVSEVMTPQVATLDPDMTVAQAWERMLTLFIKAMPVVDDSRHVIGMLTDEDLIRRAGVLSHLSVAARLDDQVVKDQLKGLQTSTLKVADVMSTPVWTARSSDSLGAAAARMAKNDIKRLPVVDDHGRLVGVIARLDILRQVALIEPRLPKAPLAAGASITVQAVMYDPVPTVSPGAGLADIVAALLETGMRRVIVVDEEGRPLGLISDSDLVSGVSPREQKGVLSALRRLLPAPPSQATAAQLMSPGVLTAPPELPLLEAARQMFSEQRKWLVVVDQNKKALGLVDRQVLLKAVSAS
jgi:CBS-domain-containing membrane protein